MRSTPYAIAAAAFMVVALSLRAQAQDLVTTKSGTEHLGRVLDATVDPLLFENTDGMPHPIHLRSAVLTSAAHVASYTTKRGHPRSGMTPLLQGDSI